jgi:hypothetical protein
MMFDPEYAISLYFNGDEALTQSDIDQLSDWIDQSHENAAKFVQASFMHRAIHDLLAGGDMKKNILLDLQETAVSGGDTSDDSSYMQALEELAEAEKTAVGIVPEESQEERDEREAFLRDHYRKSRTGHWRRFFLKAACISLVSMSILLLDNFAMFLQTRFTPTPPPVVAQLIERIDAEWDLAMQIPYDDGQMLQDTYRLTKGFVNIRFDGGAKITVEAPAEWSLQSGGNMELFEGRIYVVVSEEARGFTVTAGNTKIVDRGTEFGVELDKDSNTRLHVIKGKTLLFYGSKKGSKFEKEVNQGQARQVDSTGRIRNIALAKQKFARYIDSDRDLVWSGQPGQITLDLADVIGGGNGLGTGKLHTWLDVQTGQFTDLANQNETAARKTYVNVGASDYIDGVFTPDGGSWQVQVSSAGHIFRQCPDTEGVYTHNISNGHEIAVLGAGASRRFGEPYPPVLAGKRYGSKEYPVIILTANKGITFDLAALRKVDPDAEIQKFTAICGLSERNVVNGICQKYQGSATFWVLVDGQVRFKIGKMHWANGMLTPPARINIPINRNDRFLTLIATDGIEMPYDDSRSKISADCAIFAEPALHLVKETAP